MIPCWLICILYIFLLDRTDAWETAVPSISPSYLCGWINLLLWAGGQTLAEYIVLASSFSQVSDEICSFKIRYATGSNCSLDYFLLSYDYDTTLYSSPRDRSCYISEVTWQRSPFGINSGTWNWRRPIKTHSITISRSCSMDPPQPGLHIVRWTDWESF